MKILYLGLNFENFDRKSFAYHYPVIKIVPRNLAKMNFYFELYTHYIFTSIRAVNIFCSYLMKKNMLKPLQEKSIIAIGRSTQRTLLNYNLKAIIPESESQEGLVQLLESFNLGDSFFLSPDLHLQGGY